MIQLILSSKSNFRRHILRGITLQQRNFKALSQGKPPSPHLVGRNKMLWQQKRTQLPILNIDFFTENKTQTQQTKHAVTGVYFF